jgi:hypothetical protein
MMRSHVNSFCSIFFFNITKHVISIILHFAQLFFYDATFESVKRICFTIKNHLHGRTQIFTVQRRVKNIHIIKKYNLKIYSCDKNKNIIIFLYFCHPHTPKSSQFELWQLQAIFFMLIHWCELWSDKKKSETTK